MAAVSNNNTIPDPVELTTPVKLDAAKFPLTVASPALWQARVDLAAVYRLCHNHNFNEGTSCRQPLLAPLAAPLDVAAVEEMSR
jgi:hypothetical protein